MDSITICFPWGNPGYGSASVILLSVQQTHVLSAGRWAERDSGLIKVGDKTLAVLTGIFGLGGMVNILICFPHGQDTLLAFWVCKRLIQTSEETMVQLSLILVGFGHSLIGDQLKHRGNSYKKK